MLVYLKRILESIALVPTILALSFMGLAICLLTIEIDYETYSIFNNLIIEDAKDVQFILSFIIAGIFTLTIFSYTMVMNVLNRNINNYSPRLIPLLLSEKHHQLILGFTSGTIIYAMILSIAISSSGTSYFPSIGASLGVFFSIICILLFIYFIHSVSQSIHINYILHEVFDRTEQNMLEQDSYHGNKNSDDLELDTYIQNYKTEKAGYLSQPNYARLLKITKKQNLSIFITAKPGNFLFKGDPIFRAKTAIKSSELDKLRDCFVIDKEVPLDVPETGFKHLVEVAVKASSPAINDPGTSETAINYLTQAFLFRQQYSYHKHEKVRLSENLSRSIISNKKLLDACFDEMEVYMKNDPYLQTKLREAKSRILNND